MTIVRRIARPLLAAPLIASGVDAVRHPGPHAEAARPLVDKAAGPLKLPNDPELIVRASGAVTAAGGVLLALGKLPRLSALAIVLSAPTAQASTPFWQEKDPEQRRVQRTLFLKNLGLVGGALLASVDTEGKPGIAYRGRAYKHAAADSLEDAGKATRRGARSAKKAAKRAKKDAVRTAALAKAEAKLEAAHAKAAAKSAAQDAKKSARKSAKGAKDALPV
jgi:putative oxidoreductase